MAICSQPVRKKWSTDIINICFRCLIWHCTYEISIFSVTLQVAVSINIYRVQRSGFRLVSYAHRRENIERYAFYGSWLKDSRVTSVSADVSSVAPHEHATSLLLEFSTVYVDNVDFQNGKFRDYRKNRWEKGCIVWLYRNVFQNVCSVLSLVIYMQCFIWKFFIMYCNIQLWWRRSISVRFYIISAMKDCTFVME